MFLYYSASPGQSMCAYCRLAVSYSPCATAIVIPRSRSSGALSIDPYSRTAIFWFFVCSTFVIAAVNVVLPWSMCPIVPMFTCGFVRSYFAFAITDLRWPRQSSRGQWSPCPGLNRRPRPYQGRALPTELHGRVQSSWGPRNGPQTPDVRRPRQSRGAPRYRLERETGFEPATPCLEGWRSTAELFPPM